MSAINDGGTAVPIVEALVAFENDHQRGYYTESSGGMYLRDYFAGQALMGQLLAVGQASGLWNPAACAALAYEMADAMIKAREVEP